MTPKYKQALVLGDKMKKCSARRQELENLYLIAATESDHKSMCNLRMEIHNEIDTWLDLMSTMGGMCEGMEDV